MKNDMKLIMESWRHQVLFENTAPAAAGKQLEDALEGIFDNALEDLKAQVESDKDLNEVAGVGIMAIALWKLTLGTAGLGALLSKFGKYFVTGSGGSSDLMEKYEEFFEGVFETTATFATKPAAKFLVKMYNLGSQNSGDIDEDLEQVDKIYKIIAITIGLAVSGVELFKAAEQSGGFLNFVKELYDKAGISDTNAIQGTVDAFSTTVGATADAFDAGNFISRMTKTVTELYRIGSST